MNKLGLGLILAGGAAGAYLLLRDSVAADAWRCPNCGYQHGIEPAACFACGWGAEPGWTCPNCGFRVDEEPEICPACGTPPEAEKPDDWPGWPTDKWPHICPQCGNVREVVIAIYPPPACPVCGYQGEPTVSPRPRVQFDPLRDPVITKTDAAKVVAHYLGYDYTAVRVLTMCTSKWPDPECHDEWIVGKLGGTYLSMSIEERQDTYAVTARRYSAGTVEPYLVTTELYLVKIGVVRGLKHG